ncbi:hypothetical protein SDJN02_16376, partial [Cucurbita argyrosperma subsp. argyrosperma]
TCGFAKFLVSAALAGAPAWDFRRTLYEKKVHFRSLRTRTYRKGRWICEEDIKVRNDRSRERQIKRLPLQVVLDQLLICGAKSIPN